MSLDTARFESYPPSPLLPGTSIEIINPHLVSGRVRFALFDFDGTLSLIRAGWQQVMIPRMVEHLAVLETGESREELETIVTEFVTRLTGKQTIYQMMALAEEVAKRGGTPWDPLDYKREYLDLLWAQIGHRVEGLERGELDPTDYLVPGSLALLEGLAAAGVTMYLASGTDHPYVVNEARVLGVDRFFGPRIYGAQDDFKTFSKKMVIDRIIAENDLHGPEFLAFGDGFVEIEDSKGAGGQAVGVASDETGGGELDEWKRNRLIQAGADLIIPDYRDAPRLLEFLGVGGPGPIPN